MPRIVSVWLHEWPVTRLRRSGAVPEDGVPLVLAAAGQGGASGALRLTALDAAARGLGLRVGDPLGRVRARVGVPLRVHPADPEADAAALLRLCLWAQRYAPVVAPFGPREGCDGLHIDVTGASHLHGGEAGLLADLARRLTAAAIPARLALADTPGAAFALAHFGESGTVVPPEGLEAALRPLPTAALGCDPETFAALDRLGLRRIGDLVDAPRAPLARRFGPGLLDSLDRALGRRPDPLRALAEPAAYGAARGFLDPIGRQDDIVATVRALMRGLEPRLSAAGLGACALRITLHRVDGAAWTLDIGLSRPGRCPDHMAELLRLRLERLGRALDAGFGFECVRLDVTAAEALPDRQTAFGTAAAGDGLPALADALRQRLGRDLARLAPRASHLPERADRLVPWQPGAHSPWPGDLPPRPLVLLARSEPAEDVLALVPDGPPRRFRWRGGLHRVAHAEGPERIAAEWWRADGPARDYYAVECEDGVRLWLYRAGAPAPGGPARWFVHGLFP